MGIPIMVIEKPKTPSQPTILTGWIVCLAMMNSSSTNCEAVKSWANAMSNTPSTTRRTSGDPPDSGGAVSLELLYNAPERPVIRHKIERRSYRQGTLQGRQG